MKVNRFYAGIAAAVLLWLLLMGGLLYIAIHFVIKFW